MPNDRAEIDKLDREILVWMRTARILAKHIAGDNWASVQNAAQKQAEVEQKSYEHAH